MHEPGWENDSAGKVLNHESEFIFGEFICIGPGSTAIKAFKIFNYINKIRYRA
jgi:hypothetical protein